ncbi:MAG: ROK family protein [Armatimonas sp.]
MPTLLGIDLGGTKSAALVGNEHGEVLVRVSDATPAHKDAIELSGFLLHLAMTAWDQYGDTIEGCGVSVGGPTDAARGMVFAAPAIPGWGRDGFPLAQALSQGLNMPVTLENDADATALAEWRYGAGVGTQTMAFLTVGTGIGSGLILNGRLHRGAFGAGGEVGHLIVEPGGRRCACGMYGCLEAYASGPNIVEQAIEYGFTGEASGQAVTAGARVGDKACRMAFDQAGEMLGRGLASLTMLLNPERIVLGTMAVHAGDVLLPPALASLERNCWPRLHRHLELHPAALGDRAQDLAALCAWRSDSS